MTFCKRLSLILPGISVCKVGLSASTARALTHDDYLTSPELENAQLINHCPHPRHCKGDPKRQSTLGTVLEPGIAESRSRALGCKSAPLRATVSRLEQRAWWPPSASVQGTRRATEPRSPHCPASRAPGPAWARYSRSLWARSPQCTGFREKGQDTPRGRPPG